MADLASAPDLLRFIVGFANKDRFTTGSAARAYDALLRLTGDRVRQSARRGHLTILPADWRTWHEGTSAAPALVALQGDVRRLLNEVVDAREAVEQGRRLAFGVDDWTPVGRLGFSLRVDPSGAVVPHVVRGELRDRVIFAVVTLLASGAADLLRRCPAPSRESGVCGRYFLRSSRQRFCSRGCANRAGWRAVKADRSRLKAYRERQYEAHGWTLGARSNKRRAKRR